MGYLRFIVPLMLVYIALTGNAHPLNWLLALLLAVVVVWVIKPQPGPFDWRKAPRVLFAALLYIGLLLRDLIISGIQVARIVLSREMPIRQGIIAIPSHSDLPLVATLSAAAITLTPGELVLEIDEEAGVLYTHCLDVRASAVAADAAQQQRARLLEQVLRPAEVV